MEWGMLHVVQHVNAFPVTLGGVPHSGWLPPGAAIPLPTPVRKVSLDIEVQFDGFGYLLLYSAPDGSFHGDTWHQTLADAETAARNAFGVQSADWQKNA
jgi:hypothetical protein